MTGTSLLVPVVGVVTAPILAQALGVAGRGEAAAALAPNALVVATATLGLPEALTYHLATRPWATRRALVSTSVISTLLGALCFLCTLLWAGFLSGGDGELADLIVLATAFAVPTLLVNLLRGAASGRQMWGAVAAERLVNSLLRLVALGCLALFGVLDVRLAVIVMFSAPIVAGIAYWKLLTHPPERDLADNGMGVTPALLGFGSRIWLGAVASMLTGRLSQLLVTPLSNTEQLGLLVVAITISDVPFIVATAVRDVMFGVNSRTADAARLATTSRLATLIGFSGSAALAATVPYWIGPVFGEGFTGATSATWILLLAAVANVPGLIAGAGLGAWGRPGLRSVALVIALATNLGAFLLLVPPLGALGAALAGLISGTAVSVFAVFAAARVVGVPPARFVIPRRSDFALLVSEGQALLGKVRRRQNQ
ncbi:oligosaccharide flippase family protein [Modestobacter altitudinis]|uniref:oligosaccharide flippase family protein n=1 Tax=Modestobacter altitudinis TaxID=2213158 RepID=UPI00110CF12B|nr:oligosaccharide flippase family protein [Modestobacter altitudinis]